jgi:hypothetical protein
MKASEIVIPALRQAQDKLTYGQAEIQSNEKTSATRRTKLNCIFNKPAGFPPSRE